MKQQTGVAVKINVYQGCYVEDVAYYRYNLSLQLAERWKWYFEYLTALIKVHNPHRKVELIICSQQDVLCGHDYIREKTKNLLRAKRIKLRKTLSGRYEDDLFGFAKLEAHTIADNIQREIADLERGKFNYYVPTTYKNNVKKWISKT